MQNPTTPQPGGERPKPPPALLRLVRHTETWAIEYHGRGFWSAERQRGSEIRYLCGADMDELADAIDRAESESEPASGGHWVTRNSQPDYWHPGGSR